MSEIVSNNIKECDEYSHIKKWDDLNLNENILRGVYAYGFEIPSPIQCKAILPIISGRDLFAQAQSGTGKTATFTIGTLSVIDTGLPTTQAIILSPTRELSMQIQDVVKQLGSCIPNLRTQLLIGGSSSNNDAKQLVDNTPHVVIGCTGRVQDMITRRALNTSSVKILVVDEADEMLSSGFKDQLRNIINCLSLATQIVFFSATFPQYATDIVNNIMNNPLHIVLKKEALTLEGIKQYYVALESDMEKFSVLKDIYSKLSMTQSIIYCNSIERVTELSNALINEGFPVCYIHSHMDKKSRENSISEFRNGKQRILVSSNITARGIDIQQVGIVVNFDVCKSVHTYLHRIGRSGRWGRKGIGINFVTRRDIQTLRSIESFYQTEIIEMPINFTDI